MLGCDREPAASQPHNQLRRSEEGAGCDGAGVLLLSDHAVALDVDHDILDVGVPRPAVLLQDAHLAGPGADTGL